jgi:hypothetical protein
MDYDVHGYKNSSSNKSILGSLEKSHAKTRFFILTALNLPSVADTATRSEVSIRN